MNALDDIASEASGACKSAIETLDGNVKFYASSVRGVQQSVERSALLSTGDLDAVTESLEATRAASAKVDEACAPA
jgi:hypothetical protein